MSSVATELDKHFAVLINSKPPGSQRGQVEAITTLSETNIQSESVVVSALVRYLKRAPTTHKLGAVYIFDSVLRRWIEKAKAQGQSEVSSADEHGTFAAGVARIRDVIEPLVLDVIRVCPPDQRDKIKRLVTIWDRSGALAEPMLSNFQKSLQQAAEPERSTTPQGSPPPSIANGFQSRSNSLVPSTTATPPVAAPAIAAPPAAEPASDSASSILSRLAAIAHSSANNTPTPVVPAPAVAAPPPAPMQPPMALAANQQPPSAPAYNGYYNNGPMYNNNNNIPQPAPAVVPNASAAPALPAAQAAALASLMSTALQGGYQNPAGGAAALNPAFAAILQTLALSTAAQPQAQAQMQPQGPAQPDANQFNFGFGGKQPPTGPQADNRDYGRSPPRQRGRSRSPTGNWQRNGGRNGGEYRERSPAGNGNGSGNKPTEIREKWVQWDKSLPKDHIRVYSRTLFIGGVNYSETELHDIFANFGEVQSCIVNKDKRHAFVKMLYRDMAARAMDEMKTPEYQHYGLRTRWGVGFGPRDCSDYNTGISIIPITALTDADVKWMRTAKFGGCGDLQISTGMCVEEPDIEIGAGVSSKAISRRIQTDRGGSYGPRSTRNEMAQQQAQQQQQQQQQAQQPQQQQAQHQQQAQESHHPPTQPSNSGHHGNGNGNGNANGFHGNNYHDGPSHHGPSGRGGRGRGGFRERGRPRRDFDTPQQFGQGFDYGANY